MQHLQIAVASLVAFCWIAMMAVTALRFAERVMRIFEEYRASHNFVGEASIGFALQAFDTVPVARWSRIRSGHPAFTAGSVPL
jgi:hypothetical protein